jgi:UDP-glucose 4-epimerase
MKKTVLVIGGFGYIGVHTCIELLNNGYTVVVVDRKSLSELDKINNTIFQVTNKHVSLLDINLQDKHDIKRIFLEFDIDLVVHLAGIKSTAVFHSNALDGYQQDIFLTINLLQVMKEFGVRNIIFSSSVLTYSNSNKMPLNEQSKTSFNSPYASCKIFIENLLFDLNRSDSELNSIVLRFFNTVGVHNSGLIDDYLPEKPNNLFNAILLTLKNEVGEVKIFGDKHNTSDGSCERDFIHVMDVAHGIVLSVNLLLSGHVEKPLLFNICSAKKSSIFEVIATFENIFHKKVDFEIFPNRENDLEVSYGDNSLAREILGWQPKFNISDICKDLYRRHSNN